VFNNVEYVTGNDIHEDLLLMSKFKNKILLNTTFSAWSGFIGDVLYEKHNVFVPSYLDKFDKICNKFARYANPKWNIINV
jgi:hypothetical protein